MPRATNDLNYDWFWFLTWTTYGSWLPGDSRGSIGTIHDQDKNKIEQNEFGEPIFDPSDALQNYARSPDEG